MSLVLELGHPGALQGGFNDSEQGSSAALTELEKGSLTELEKGSLTEIEKGNLTELEKSNLTEIEKGSLTKLEKVTQVFSGERNSISRCG